MERWQVSLALIHDALDSDGLLDKEKYNSSSLDERRTEDDRIVAKKCHFMQLLSIISQKTQNFFFFPDWPLCKSEI